MATKRADSKAASPSKSPPTTEEVWTLSTGREHEGITLAAALRAARPELSWNKARELCRSGRVLLQGTPCTDPAQRLCSGQSIEARPAARRLRKDEFDRDRIVHLDAHIVVVEKPTGLMSVPYENERDTLSDLLRNTLRRMRGGGGRGKPGGSKQGRSKPGGSSHGELPLGVVQRLDKDTTGLLVFARTQEARDHLADQFRAHDVHRRYLALVHGAARDGHHESMLLQDRGDGLRGSHGHFRRPKGPPPGSAKQATTDVRVRERLTEATLVSCRLGTGRQHQIRIHLSESGHPLIGERVYIRDYRGTPIRASRPMLHASQLGFVHPATGERMRWESPLPTDFQECLQRLRAPRNQDPAAAEREALSERTEVRNSKIPDRS